MPPTLIMNVRRRGRHETGAADAVKTGIQCVQTPSIRGFMAFQPQTVRYRMRQIHELFGDQLRDPDRRFELQLALRIRTLSAG